MHLFFRVDTKSDSMVAIHLLHLRFAYESEVVFPSQETSNGIVYCVEHKSIVSITSSCAIIAATDHYRVII